MKKDYDEAHPHSKKKLWFFVVAIVLSIVVVQIISYKKMKVVKSNFVSDTNISTISETNELKKNEKILNMHQNV